MLVDLVGTKQKINFVKCVFSILVKADVANLNLIVSRE